MKYVKFYRRKKGYTQEDVASFLGVDQSSYCRKERGDTAFTVEEAKKLMQLLNTSFEELFR